MKISVRMSKYLSPVYLQVRKAVAKKTKTISDESSNSRPLKVKIGLEIHARIQSSSKIFSDAECSQLKHSAVNSQVSVFDAALPGTMPTLNRRCVEASLLTALALNCSVNSVSLFERKHYFYADLPAGYQITQQRQPIAFSGTFNYPVISPKTRRLTYKQVRIRRIQLEHDSARSLLTDDLIVKSSTSTLQSDSTLIDLNRVGMGLMEIVTEPDFDEAFDSYSFARELALTLRSLGTCEANMSDGGFRVDVNVSVHERDPNDPDRVLPGVRVELKNLNSFNAVLKATEYEIERQKGLVLSGGRVELETRTYDSETRKTVSIRSKEDQYDYRFMPEPNLLPLVVYSSDNNHGLVVNQEFSDYISSIKLQDKKFYVDFNKVNDEFKSKQLPQTRREYIIENFHLSHENAFVFIANNLDTLLIEMMKIKGDNWSKEEIEFINRILLHEYLGLVNANVDLDSIDLRRRCEKILSYGELLKSKAISRRVKNTVFAKLFEPANINKMARDLVKEMDLFLISDEKVINDSILKLFEQNSAAINEYKSKEKKRVKIFDFFVGRVHKDLNERADPELVDKLVLDNLKKTIQS